MDDVMKLIKIAVSVLITLAVIGFVVYLFTMGRDMFRTSDAQMVDLQERLTQTNYGELHDTTVKGSQVVSYIRGNTSNVTITVTTKASGGTRTYTKDDVYNVSDSLNANYINPTADFMVTVSKNANDIVDGVTFTQQ
ncbi:UNVERIFIED_CONTAM: hypothetical protein Cloal_2515 [Acetivibrio alkalicellulosi]